MASLSPIIFHWKIKHSASHFLCHINMTTPFDIGIQGMLEPQEHTWSGFFLPPWGFPGGSSNKKSTCSAGDTFSPWVMKIPWRRSWQHTPVLLLGKSHEQRSLADYSPWGSQRVGHDWVRTHTHTQSSWEGSWLCWSSWLCSRMGQRTNPLPPQVLALWIWYSIVV